MPHEGELELRRRVGADLGDGPVRSTISPGLATFLSRREFVLLASHDADGLLWTTVLWGAAGFLETDGRRLTIRASPESTCPLTATLRPGQDVGLLAIDPERRHRARINGRVASGDASLSIDVHEAYGNCPKYITPRAAHRRDAATTPAPCVASRLTDADVAIVASADTFFIGSAHPTAGADASHRGGPPGFVRILDERTLAWDDFPGNDLFQTLGNLTRSPRAGLLFVDFDTGDLLHLAGTATISDPGGARTTRFSVEKAVRRPRALPFVWAPGRAAPR